MCVCFINIVLYSRSRDTGYKPRDLNHVQVTKRTPELEPHSSERLQQERSEDFETRGRFKLPPSLSDARSSFDVSVAATLWELDVRRAHTYVEHILRFQRLESKITFDYIYIFIPRPNKLDINSGCFPQKLRVGLQVWKVSYCLSCRSRHLTLVLIVSVPNSCPVAS
ncbi:hypothetical protein TNCV_838221 [Trichonephila clavipes]|nr:hypothetical protein TNCV_838221 [Trichonephila clavipes]